MYSRTSTSVCTVGPLLVCVALFSVRRLIAEKNHVGTSDCVLCREVFLFGKFTMYCRNYTGTVSHVLCREVYYTVSLFGRVHYQRFHCSLTLPFFSCSLISLVCRRSSASDGQRNNQCDNTTQLHPFQHPPHLCRPWDSHCVFHHCV